MSSQPGNFLTNMRLFLTQLVDYLTGTYLEEQYTGQRALAGKISTLDKMTETHGAIGEFLYDKKMLA